MEWFSYSEEERIKNVYSKYKIEDFWNWWSDTEKVFMEIRILNFDLIRYISEKFNVPKSSSGVYVDNHIVLLSIIKAIREKSTVWYGIQPRRKTINKYGYNAFGGEDKFVFAIKHLFIDIDRKEKKASATSDELSNADKLSNILLEKFNSMGWANNYCKICSGNGLQLLIKLDFPILVPELSYNVIRNEKQIDYVPIDNPEYEKVRKLISLGIGREITMFSKKNKELTVSVDDNSFKLSQVGALPCTKNFKYGTFTWRGIIDIVNKGQNEGLADYIYERDLDKYKTYKSKVFTKRPISLTNKVNKVDIRSNPLYHLIMDNELVHGNINNTLWFQFKCLCRDSGIDFSGKEFNEVKRDIERKYKDTYPGNVPEKKYSFSEATINRYCINNCIPPIYPLFPSHRIKNNYGFDNISLDILHFYSVRETPILKEEYDILEDLYLMKSKLIEYSLIENIQIFVDYITAMISKYGRDKIDFIMKYIFDRYINYS